MPATDPRLRALVERYGLPGPALVQLQTLLDRLLTEHAPTSVRDRESAIDDHLADSLSALELPVLRDAHRIADIGAGAGLPGLALAIALPDARVTLVDSIARKCRFIAQTAEDCGLTNVEVVTARAEDWEAGHDAFDVVTARALARIDVVAEYAAPLLVVGGSLVAYRGRRDPEDERAAELAAEKLRLEQAQITAVTPYPGAQYRHLHVLRKIGSTPAGFPRRPGMARKRPLGGPITSSTAS